MSFGSLYLYYKTAKFTAKKFYWHVLMGERQWEFEADRQNSCKIVIIIAWGEYYFNDTPISSEENFPALAKAESTKKKRNTGSMNW